MDARLQLRVQRYGWDAAVSHYEKGWSEQLAGAQDTCLDMADLQPGQRVIETACGSGLVTRRLSEVVGSEGHVDATDLSQKMVDATAALGLGNVETHRMGAEALDLPDQSFDRAISALCLMYVPDPRKAISEMFRLLKPGGRAVATVWGERRNCGWAEIFPIVDARVVSEVCPMFFGTGAPGLLAADFEAAGFRDVKEKREASPLVFPDKQQLLDAMLLGGPVALAVSRFDDATLAEVSDEFLASVEDHRNADGSYAIPGEFVTVTGLK